MKTKSKYLIIEPYVHYYIMEGKAFFYNTLSGNHLLLDDFKTIGELKDFGLDNYSSVMKIEADFEHEVKDFIDDLKCLYIGDVIEAYDKPFYFDKKAILNNISENNIDGDTNRNITESIHELNFFINSLNGNYRYNNAYKQFLFPRINTGQELNIGNMNKLIREIDGYHKRNINFIIGDLENLNFDISIFGIESSSFNCFLFYKTILDSSKVDFLEPFAGLNIYISSEIELNEVELLLKKLDSFALSKTTFHLVIESENDYVKLDEISTKFELKAQYKPLFMENITFFETNIFVDEEDILTRKLTLNEIHQRLLINPSFFGKLYILENGDIYSNLNSTQLGNIRSSDVKELVYEELTTGESFWKRTRRNVFPCKSCVYNALCPPISNYEYAIGKYNLCHVFEN